MNSVEQLLRPPLMRLMTRAMTNKAARNRTKANENFKENVKENDYVMRRVGHESDRGP